MKKNETNNKKELMQEIIIGIGITLLIIVIGIEIALKMMGK